jgi:acetyl-CoA C-acetyltransferase
MPHVDQAAALVVTSLGTAREHGIADDQLVHVWGGAGADGDPDVLARSGFGAVDALGVALDACLAASGARVSDVDLVDVYSCFPVVPKLVALHLGLPREAPLSVTGGHSSFGGPLNSYSLHALATTVERLRSGGGSGLVHANGGYLTHQHAVLLSSRPHPDGYVGDPEPRQVRAADPVRVLLPAQVEGQELVVETATVEHDRAGSPAQAFVVTRTAAGARVAAATPYGDSAAAQVLSLAALPVGRTTHVGRAVRLEAQPDGTVLVTPV